MWAQTTTPLILALLVAQVSDGAKESKARAKEMIVHGTEAFEREQYEEAARLFLEAYDLLATQNLGVKPELLHNAAVAFEKLGDCERSAPLFVRHAELDPKALSSPELAERHRRALACAPLVAIETSPAGASVIIDERARGVTPLSLHLKTGEHQLALALEGHERAEETITVAKPETFSRALAPIPPPPPPPAPVLAVEPPPAPPPSFSPSAWFWVSAGAVAAALVAGIVLGVLASREYDLYRTELAKPDDCDCRTLARDAEERGRELSLGANISYGAAAVGLGAAALLFFLEP